MCEVGVRGMWWLWWCGEGEAQTLPRLLAQRALPGAGRLASRDAYHIRDYPRLPETIQDYPRAILPALL